MVLCTLHLISLKEGISLSAFLSSLHGADIKPIAQARVLRWMILPKQISAGHLLARNIHWDALLILDSSSSSSSPASAAALKSIFANSVSAEWTASVGTSSKLLSSYASTNAQLLNPSPDAPSNIKPVALDLEAAKKADSSENLELTPEMAHFISALPSQLKTHPVSMLNLLSFNRGKHAQYVKYGQEFSARVGSRYGGHVKIVGKVTSSGAGAVEGIEPKEQGKEEGWDEIAFVHYPSIINFAAMAGDKDYQDVNHTYRLGALKDTFILCVLEVGVDGEPVGLKRKGVQMKL